jgi:hypothetical protein
VIAARLILDTIGVTAGRITMAGLTIITTVIFLIMAIGSKIRAITVRKNGQYRIHC